MIKDNSCSDCLTQEKKGRYDPPHVMLKKAGAERVFRGGMFGGYKEQDHVCQACGRKWTYSTDKNDCGWV